MAAKAKGLLLLLAVVLLLSSGLAVSFEDVLADDSRGDPEQRLQQCRRQCQQQQQQRGQQQRMQCERSCEEQYKRERQQREREQQGGNRDPAARRYEECLQQCSKQGRYDEQQRRQCVSRCEARYQEERRGRTAELEETDRKDPEQRLQECREGCRRREHDRSQEQQCEQWCEEQYRKERGRWKRDPQRREEEWEEEQEEVHNPYHFDRQSFRWIEKTEQGNIRVLPNFLEKSKLLLGIANYRIVVTELKPRGFVLPKHVDADAFVYVAKGCGVITLIRQEKKETYELQQGDIIKVPAGAVRYLANKDNDEKLVLIELLKPVSTPGFFELFYGAGAQNFLKSFSDEILEAAFNTRGERVERLFGQQKKAGIVTASEQQIRELSRHSSEGRHWPFGESEGKFNLLRKRPVHSSRRGHLHEADGNDYQPLKEHDIQISYANITEGSMIAPYFNSRATKIAVVVEGEAYIETICPHLSKRRQSREWEVRGKKEEEEGEGQWYKRVRFHVRRGSVAILPPGHPTVTVASSGEHGKGNFEAVCFEISAEKNERNFLAGKNNVWKQMEREAKELAFDMPAREVDEVLQAQNEQIIIAGPEEREGGGGGGGRRDLPLLELATAFM